MRRNRTRSFIAVTVAAAAAWAAPGAVAHATAPPPTVAYSCWTEQGTFLAQVGRYDNYEGSGKIRLGAVSDGGGVTMIKVLGPDGTVLASRAGGHVTLGPKFVAKHPTVTVWVRIRKASDTAPIPSCTTRTFNLTQP